MESGGAHVVKREGVSQRPGDEDSFSDLGHGQQVRIAGAWICGLWPSSCPLRPRGRGGTEGPTQTQYI